MKSFINSVLRKTVGVDVRGVALPTQEFAFPSHANYSRRFIYFYDLLLRVRDVEGDIVECGVGYQDLTVGWRYKGN